MPTEEKFYSKTLKKTLTFSDSRDFKGTDFKNYITPAFFRGDMPKWQGLIVRDQLRANGELYALNKPAFYDMAIKNFQVSPVIPEGIYKNRTRALVYFWKDGEQITKEYFLVSMDQLQPQQISEQIQESIFSEIVQMSQNFWGSELLNTVTLGIGGFIADKLQLLKNEIDGVDIYGVWVEGATVSQPIDIVTADTTKTQSKTTDIVKQQQNSLLPWIVSGLGVVSGQPIIIGAGLLLRFLESRK